MSTSTALLDRFNPVVSDLQIQSSRLLVSSLYLVFKKVKFNDNRYMRHVSRVIDGPFDIQRGGGAGYVSLGGKA